MSFSFFLAFTPVAFSFRKLPAPEARLPADGLFSRPFRPPVVTGPTKVMQIFVLNNNVFAHNSSFNDLPI